MRLCCQHCDAIIVYDEQKIAGCLCDPDAPTWVGIDREGRVISGSYASYEYLPKEN